MSSADMFKQASEALSSASSPARDNLLVLLKEWHELEGSIADLDGMLSGLNARKQEMKTKSLPDAMAALGSGEWTGEILDEDGKVDKIKMEDFVSGSLPKEEPQRTEAVEWLEQNGGGELIKTVVEASFGKSQHNVALEVFGQMQKLAEEAGFQITMASGVHPQTYLAFMREKLGEGANVPTEKMNLFIGRIAKVNKVKPKKRLVK